MGVTIGSENSTVIRPFILTRAILAIRGIFGLEITILTFNPVLLSIYVLKATLRCPEEPLVFDEFDFEDDDPNYIVP